MFSHLASDHCASTLISYYVTIQLQLSTLLKHMINLDITLNILFADGCETLPRLVCAKLR